MKCNLLSTLKVPSAFSETFVYVCFLRIHDVYPTVRTVSEGHGYTLFDVVYCGGLSPREGGLSRLRMSERIT